MQSSQSHDSKKCETPESETLKHTTSGETLEKKAYTPPELKRYTSPKLRKHKSYKDITMLFAVLPPVPPAS